MRSPWGELVGEQCCLEPGIRSATVTASSRVQCLELTHDALERMLVARPRVASQVLSALLEDLSERVRGVELRIVEIVGGVAAPARPSSLAFASPPPSTWERLRSRFVGTG